jgi:hypothetical protein
MVTKSGNILLSPNQEIVWTVKWKWCFNYTVTCKQESEYVNNTYCYQDFSYHGESFKKSSQNIVLEKIYKITYVNYRQVPRHENVFTSREKKIQYFDIFI